MWVSPKYIRIVLNRTRSPIIDCDRFQQSLLSSVLETLVVGGSSVRE